MDIAVMTAKIDPRTRNSIWRLLLRSIPLVPGPELFDVLQSIRKSQSDFEGQVEEAVESLRNTSTLITTLQKNVEERMTQLEKLSEEHKRYSELAQIELEKAQPIIRQVERTLGTEQRKERWIALAMHLGVGFLFFVLGVALSDFLKRWIDYLWARIYQ
jgi:hypothetical protein